jgi:hypothetical protein
MPGIEHSASIYIQKDKEITKLRKQRKWLIITIVALFLIVYCFAKKNNKSLKNLLSTDKKDEIDESELNFRPISQE